MKSYDVALGNNIEALIADVERLAAMGYVPQGGIAISESYGRMAQAMVFSVTIDKPALPIKPPGKQAG